MIRTLLSGGVLLAAVCLLTASGFTSAVAGDLGATERASLMTVSGEVPCPSGKIGKAARIACRIQPGVCDSGCMDCVSTCNEVTSACMDACPGGKAKKACKLGCKTARAACREVCKP